MKPIARLAAVTITGLGSMLRARLELLRQPVHVVHVVSRPLGVPRLLVVAAAAREVRGAGWSVPGSVR